MPPQAGQGPGLPPDPMAGLGGPPPGPPPAPAAPGMAPDPMQAGGGLQLPSTDPNAVMALLSTLIATDQQKVGDAQMQAVGGAFSQLMQSMPDPAAAAAVTAGGAPPAPPPGDLGGPSGAGY